MSSPRTIDDVYRENSPKLLETPGVIGTYISRTREGEPCVKVMVEREPSELEATLPRELEGYAVLVIPTDDLRQRRGRARSN